MQPVIKAFELTKRYNGISAVDDISFEIYPGEILGFLGPNGAGKTTTIKMICGLLKADSGRIEKSYKDGNSIGICPQNIVIWDNLTCIEQLVFSGIIHGLSSSISNKRGNELLEAFGLTEKRHKLARTLSGGMQRRLNIALALIHNPEIVFLDEPQAGLDPQSRILVREYIQSVKNITTIVLTTHDMEEAEKLSDRIYIIDRGKILISGTIDNIKNLSGQEDLIEMEIDGDIRRELLPFLNNELQNKISIIDNTLSFVNHDSIMTIEDIIQIVKEKNIRLLNLRLRKKSLEDVFINLTGRRLRE